MLLLTFPPQLNEKKSRLLVERTEPDRPTRRILVTMTTRETRTLLRVFNTISLAAVKQSGLGPVLLLLLLRETRTLFNVFNTISLATVKQSGLGPASRQMLLSTWKRTESGNPRGQLHCRDKYLETGG